MKKIVLVFLIVFFTISTKFSQTSTTLSQIATFNGQSGWLYFKNPNAVNPNSLFVDYAGNFGLSADDAMSLIKTEVDNLGITHSFYQQYYKGIKVENCQFNVHSKSSATHLANGQICTGLNLTIAPTITGTDAINYAKSYVNASLYMWEDSIEQSNIKKIKNDPNASYYPNPELLIAMTSGTVSFTPLNFKLAYKVGIYAKIPFDAKTIYVDANTGNIIKEEDIFSYGCTPSANSPRTLFSGDQSINVNQIANPAHGGAIEYKLENPCKGGGVLTNETNVVGTLLDVFDTDNIWPDVSTATDQQKALSQVHWAAEKYYDFLLAKFNRQGIDNQNAQMLSVVDHYGQPAGSTINVPNAVYGNNAVYYYDGTGNISFCSTDITGHEWGHGVSHNMTLSNWTASPEAMAIDEGCSDIFGTLFENYLEGSAYDWKWAEDFTNLNSGSSTGIRNLMDPYSLGMPDAYLGTFYAGAQPHEKGSIMGHWFYLLSQGGSGTNHGLPAHGYNVSAIGLNEASKIFYQAYNYLNGGNITYHNMRNATIQAGSDIYGSDCNFYIDQIKAAWDAVDVFDDSPCGLSFCITKNVVNCSPSIKANITINVTGGVGPYFYQLNNDAGTELSSDFNSTGVTTFFNLGPGSYYITVYDQSFTEGCSQTSFPIIIYGPASAISISANINTSSLCLGQCVTINASGAYTYLYNGAPSPLLSTFSDCPTSTTTYTVTGVAIDGCTKDTKTINVIVHPPITVSASTQSICPGQSSIITPNGATSYVLTPPGGPATPPFIVSPSSTTNYQISGTDSYGCTTTQNIPVTVDPAFCCSQGTAFSISSGNVTGGVYNLNSAFTLTGDLTLNNLTIFAGVNGEIIVPNDIKLTLNGVHILGCPIMWHGIKCTGAKASVVFNTNTLIEDAITAIDLKDVIGPKTGESLILNINASTFNKNFTSINIENYNSSVDYPSSIVGSVFTSRKLITSDHTTYLGAGATTYNWNTSTANAVLKSTTYNPSTPAVMGTGTGVNVTDQFSAASYPSSNLSVPHQNTIGRQGILLNNVAYGNGNSLPFKGFVIGLGGTDYNTLNLFDNLNIGINAINSNLGSYNTAYQNMSQYEKRGGSFDLIFYDGGAGIKTESKLITDVNKLTVLPASANSFNKSGNFFFNNSYGVLAKNLQYSDIQYAMMHSNRIYPPSKAGDFSISNGSYGIYLTTNSYPNIKMNSNYITNINTAISFYATGVSTEQVYGLAVITNNFLQSDYTGNPTNRSMGLAIVADNLFNCKECISNDDLNPISVNNNQIKNAFRGIKSSNWKLKTVYAANNTIVLKQEPNNLKGFETTQYGILHENNFRDVVNANTITGFSPTAKKAVYAVLARDNSSQLMLCNSTASTYEGFSFAGSQNIVTWQNNKMQSHSRGMHLNNTIIGQQGSPGKPMDNVWQLAGSGWTGTNFQTYITTSTAGTNATNSKLYVKNVATIYKPTNNGASAFLTDYASANALINTTGSSPYKCPIVFNPGTGSSSTSPHLKLIDNPEQTAALKRIVKDSVIYSEFIPNKKIISKESVYALLKQNLDVLTTEPDLQNFYNLRQAGNTEVLITIEDNLSKDNHTLAMNDLTNLNPQNNIETNTRSFYQSYSRYREGNLTISDKEQIFILAKGCPDRDGAVVYQARVLHNMITQKTEHFEDSCVIANANRMTNDKTTFASEIAEQTLSLPVYPNPTNGKCLLDLRNANLNAMLLKVYDVNSRVIYQENANNITTDLFELNLEVRNGIYFIEITDLNSDIQYKQKLIIQK